MLKRIYIGLSHSKEDFVKFTERRIHWPEYSLLHMGLGCVDHVIYICIKHIIVAV